jgi:hypothetical protein
MKRVFFYILIITALSACKGKEKLYSWGNYDKTSYNYLKNSDEKATDTLEKTYQKILRKQKGGRGVVPPGIYADYGFLKLEQGKNEDGKKLLLQEIALYPEASIFIERIIKLAEE